MLQTLSEAIMWGVAGTVQGFKLRVHASSGLAWWAHPHACRTDSPSYIYYVYIRIDIYGKLTAARTDAGGVAIMMLQ